MGRHALVRRCIIVATLSSFPVVPSGLAHAADRFWVDPNGGFFADTGNWSTTSGGSGGASVPVIRDSAIFDQRENYTVTLNADAALDLLDVDAGTITFDSSGGQHTYDLRTGDADATFIGSEISLNQTNLLVGDDFISYRRRDEGFGSQ